MKATEDPAIPTQPVKALLWLLAAIAAYLEAELAKGPITREAVYNAILLGLGAIAVWVKKNTASQPWAKTLVALATTVVTALYASYSDHHLSSVELLQLLIAVMGVFGVAVAKNNAKRLPSRSSEYSGREA